MLKIARNVYFITFAAAISGLLFGYDAGIISGAMLFIKKQFPLTDAQIGMIVSAVPAGALISALLIGKCSDIFGRKKILLTTAVLFGLGSLVCAFANGVNGLILGRALMGFAVGMSSSLAPVYIAEMAEEKRRGGLVTLFLISVNGGIFVSYLINYVYAGAEDWRSMLGVGVVPAVILFCCAAIIPESPRWLAVRGRVQEAFQILRNLHGEEKSMKEMKEIETILHQEKTSLKTLFQKNFIRVLLLGIIISIFTQAVGINAIIYYAPTIFQLTGFNQSTVSILATVGIGFTVTLAAVVAAVIIDRVGRRKLLLNGLAGIIVCLIMIIYGFAEVTDPKMLGWIILLSSIAFVACQGLSVGPACFLLPSEIFPAKIRGTAMGISIAFNWITNTIVAFLFPIVLHRWGAANSFAVFLVTSILGWILFYLYVPETKDVSLETMEMNLISGTRLRDLG